MGLEAVRRLVGPDNPHKDFRPLDSGELWKVIEALRNSGVLSAFSRFRAQMWREALDFVRAALERDEGPTCSAPASEHMHGGGW